MLAIDIQKTKNPKQKPLDSASLGFGKIFTDHMLIADYIDGKWTKPVISEFKPIEMHPATAVLHYGAEVFEGLKAYRRPDGKVQMFRPLENLARLNDSADRICLPKIVESDWLDMLNAFVNLERDWVPATAGASLYLRPFMFALDEFLGVAPPKKVRFMLIASPVGSYYSGGLNPVRILVEETDVRAVRGGTGHIKCGGNYAASLRANHNALKKGFEQVLWLDAVERKYIEEVGAMNVMFKIGDEVLTPELGGSILPGITRKSCIEILKAQGMRVTERRISVEELVSAATNGTLLESWGTGTAAVIAPIGEFNVGGKSYCIAGGKIGTTTQNLYDTLTNLQWGKTEDRFGWTQLVL